MNRNLLLLDILRIEIFACILCATNLIYDFSRDIGSQFNCHRNKFDFNHQFVCKLQFYVNKESFFFLKMSISM